MKTYAVGNYGVEVSKTWKGWEWNVHKDGKQLQSGNAISAPDGQRQAYTWIEAQSPPVVVAGSVIAPSPEPAVITSAASASVNVSEGVKVEPGNAFFGQFNVKESTATAYEYRDADGQIAEPPADELPLENCEPATPSDRTKIKADFPASEHLIAAGYTTFGKVRHASDEELLEVEHIGPAALAKIREAQ